MKWEDMEKKKRDGEKEKKWREREEMMGKGRNWWKSWKKDQTLQISRISIVSAWDIWDNFDTQPIQEDCLECAEKITQGDNINSFTSINLLNVNSSGLVNWPRSN